MAEEAVSATRSDRPPTFAAIDLGTNNCRLLVGTPAPGGFRVVDSFSRVVRLGEGLHETGLLNPFAMDRAIAALHGCAARLTRRPVRALHAVATEACRRAVNGAEFLRRVERETGLPVAVITPREEAQLALESCLPLLRGARRALLFDIGGGSTELAWVRLDGRHGPEMIGYDSLPAGVVTLSEQFGAAAFSATGFTAMEDAVAARVRAFEAVHCIRHEMALGGVRVIGTSGTVTTLAGITMNLVRYRRPLVDGTVLTAADAESAIAALRRLGRAGLAAHPCVGADRADLVLPGCAVFRAIHAVWPVGEVIVADRGLREGMLTRMMAAASQFGPRPRRAPYTARSTSCPA